MCSPDFGGARFVRDYLSDYRAKHCLRIVEFLFYEKRVAYGEEIKKNLLCHTTVPCSDCEICFRTVVCFMGVAEETPQLLGEEIREDFMMDPFTPPWRMRNIMGEEVESVSDQMPHEDLSALLLVVLLQRGGEELPVRAERSFWAA
jgi:hypothetical protein